MNKPQTTQVLKSQEYNAKRMSSQFRRLFETLSPLLSKEETYHRQTIRVRELEQVLTLPRVPVLIDGWLFKIGKNNARWKKRWFILQDRMIKYYKSDTQNSGAVPLGIIDLRKVYDVVRLDNFWKREYIFGILLKDRMYVLRAYLEEQLNDWMTAINLSLLFHRIGQRPVRDEDTTLIRKLLIALDRLELKMFEKQTEIAETTPPRNKGSKKRSRLEKKLEIHKRKLTNTIRAILDWRNLLLSKLWILKQKNLTNFALTLIVDTQDYKKYQKSSTKFADIKKNENNKNSKDNNKNKNKEQEKQILKFKKWDIIQVYNESDQNWWLGECNGVAGWFNPNGIAQLIYNGKSKLSEYCPEEEEKSESIFDEKKSNTKNSTKNKGLGLFYKDLNISLINFLISNSDKSTFWKEVRCDVFLFTKYQLFHFNSKPNSEIKFTVPLSDVISIVNAKAKMNKENCFEIKMKKLQSVILTATNKKTYNNWVDTLQILFDLIKLSKPIPISECENQKNKIDQLLDFIEQKDENMKNKLNTIKKEKKEKKLKNELELFEIQNSNSKIKKIKITNKIKKKKKNLFTYLHDPEYLLKNNILLLIDQLNELNYIKNQLLSYQARLYFPNIKETEIAYSIDSNQRKKTNIEELSFEKRQWFLLRKQIDEFYLQVETGEKIGIVPCNKLKIIKICEYEQVFKLKDSLEGGKKQLKKQMSPNSSLKLQRQLNINFDVNTISGKSKTEKNNKKRSPKNSLILKSLSSPKKIRNSIIIHTKIRNRNKNSNFNNFLSNITDINNNRGNFNKQTNDNNQDKNCNDNDNDPNQDNNCNDKYNSNHSNDNNYNFNDGNSSYYNNYDGYNNENIQQLESIINYTNINFLNKINQKVDKKEMVLKLFENIEIAKKNRTAYPIEKIGYLYLKTGGGEMIKYWCHFSSHYLLFYKNNNSLRPIDGYDIRQVISVKKINSNKYQSIYQEFILQFKRGNNIILASLDYSELVSWFSIFRICKNFQLILGPLKMDETKKERNDKYYQLIEWIKFEKIKKEKNKFNNNNNNNNYNNNNNNNNNIIINNINININNDDDDINNNNNNKTKVNNDRIKHWNQDPNEKFKNISNFINSLEFWRKKILSRVARLNIKNPNDNRMRALTTESSNSNSNSNKNKNKNNKNNNNNNNTVLKNNSPEIKNKNEHVTSNQLENLISVENENNVKNKNYEEINENQSKRETKDEDLNQESHLNSEQNEENVKEKNQKEKETWLNFQKNKWLVVIRKSEGGVLKAELNKKIGLVKESKVILTIPILYNTLMEEEYQIKNENSNEILEKEKELKRYTFHNLIQNLQKRTKPKPIKKKKDNSFEFINYFPFFSQYIIYQETKPGNNQWQAKTLIIYKWNILIFQNNQCKNILNLMDVKSVEINKNYGFKNCFFIEFINNKNFFFLMESKKEMLKLINLLHIAINLNFILMPLKEQKLKLKAQIKFKYLSLIKWFEIAIINESIIFSHLYFKKETQEKHSPKIANSNHGNNNSHHDCKLNTNESNDNNVEEKQNMKKKINQNIDKRMILCQNWMNDLQKWRKFIISRYSSFIYQNETKNKKIKVFCLEDYKAQTKNGINFKEDDLLLLLENKGIILKVQNLDTQETGIIPSNKVQIADPTKGDDDIIKIYLKKNTFHNNIKQLFNIRKTRSINDQNAKQFQTNFLFENVNLNTQYKSKAIAMAKECLKIWLIFPDHILNFPIFYSGFLFVNSQRSLSSKLVTRWVVLQGWLLLEYENDQEEDLINVIDLRNVNSITSSEIQNKKYQHQIMINFDNFQKKVLIKKKDYNHWYSSLIALKNFINLFFFSINNQTTKELKLHHLFSLLTWIQNKIISTKELKSGDENLFQFYTEYDDLFSINELKTTLNKLNLEINHLNIWKNRIAIEIAKIKFKNKVFNHEKIFGIALYYKIKNNDVNKHNDNSNSNNYKNNLIKEENQNTYLMDWNWLYILEPFDDTENENENENENGNGNYNDNDNQLIFCSNIEDELTKFELEKNKLICIKFKELNKELFLNFSKIFINNNNNQNNDKDDNETFHDNNFIKNENNKLDDLPIIYKEKIYYYLKGKISSKWTKKYLEINGYLIKIYNCQKNKKKQLFKTVNLCQNFKYKTLSPNVVPLKFSLKNSYLRNVFKIEFPEKNQSSLLFSAKDSINKFQLTSNLKLIEKLHKFQTPMHKKYFDTKKELLLSQYLLKSINQSFEKEKKRKKEIFKQSNLISNNSKQYSIISPKIELEIKENKHLLINLKIWRKKILSKILYLNKKNINHNINNTNNNNNNNNTNNNKNGNENNTSNNNNNENENNNNNNKNNENDKNKSNDKNTKIDNHKSNDKNKKIDDDDDDDDDKEIGYVLKSIVNKEGVLEIKKGNWVNIIENNIKLKTIKIQYNTKEYEIKKSFIEIVKPIKSIQFIEDLIPEKIINKNENKQQNNNEKKSPRGNERPKKIPFKKIEQLHKLLFVLQNEQLLFTMTISKIVNISDLDLLSKSLITIFEVKRFNSILIEQNIQNEVEKTEFEGTLFRGNCMASKMMNTYAKNVALNYLSKTLKDIINEIIQCEESFEIIPQYIAKQIKTKVTSNRNNDGVLNPDEDEINETIKRRAKKNLELLKKYVIKTLNAILNSLELCPLALRDLCCKLFSATSKKFPNSKYIVVAGFIFLRFICPAIVVPEKYGITDKIPSIHNRRNLILLSKVVQSVANGATFNEENMQLVNPIVEQFIPKLQIFMNNLVEPCFLCKDLNEQSEYLIIAKNDQKFVACEGKTLSQNFIQVNADDLNLDNKNYNYEVESFDVFDEELLLHLTKIFKLISIPNYKEQILDSIKSNTNIYEKVLQLYND
ncbi:ras gtpase-activating protein [Anaeramoeba flamelloides]|uniref:Ras gtpase-activating protein n=1 Tax=Anaeramoeba flamelloides TaxID=1746091 RepID=A0AAV7ZLT1_9EUKA|nr:ras gtpase-activating protein [Anaeramoeba flamelloides]